MKEELEQLERRLTLATAPSGTDVGDLDADTAELRAGWLALGELLDRTEASRDEPQLCWPLPAASTRGPLGLSAAALAMAVSLLVAASLFLKHPAVTPIGATTAQVRPAAATTALTNVPAPRLDAATAWNDSLDAEIETAGLAVREVRENDLAMATASDQVQYQMELLKRELENNSL